MTSIKDIIKITANKPNPTIVTIIPVPAKALGANINKLDIAANIATDACFLDNGLMYAFAPDKPSDNALAG